MVAAAILLLAVTVVRNAIFMGIETVVAAAAGLQVEATKYTEVGFHGRDVEQIIK